jgi:hypothetical protein
VSRGYFSWTTLKDYLKNLEPGPVEETTHLERLLAEIWDDLGGDNSGMTGQKLIGRMESVRWHPPVLSFSIERHGGTVLGSTRAELQQWSVDLDRQIATCEASGHRQLSRMAKWIELGSIADEIADRVRSCEADDRLSWLSEGRVRVEVGKIFPSHSGYKQTVQGRRQRFRKALVDRLTARGWVHLGRNMFGQPGFVGRREAFKTGESNLAQGPRSTE